MPCNNYDVIINVNSIEWLFLGETLKKNLYSVYMPYFLLPKTYSVILDIYRMSCLKKTLQVLYRHNMTMLVLKKHLTTSVNVAVQSKPWNPFSTHIIHPYIYIPMELEADYRFI